MENILPQRRALLGLIIVGLALGFDVDRGTVERRRNRAGEEGAVIAGIVPGESALVAAILPEGNRELDRFDGRLAVEDNLLATLIDLHAAERPQEWIPERRRVAEAVAEGLDERLAFRFQLFADGAVLVPGFGKIAGA